MSALSKLQLLDTVHGDVTLEQQQAADIGAAMGNGAASFLSPAAPGVIPMGDDGNIFVSFPNNGAGISPASTGNDNVLAVFQIPKGAFDIANRGIALLAAGNAPNTNVRTMKIIVNPTTAVVGQAVVGGTTIATANNTAAQAGASGGWEIAANLFKYGAPGSNTQMAIHESGQVGSVIAALTAPSLTTFNESGAITIAITGNAGVVTDIVLNFLQAFGMN